VLMRTVEGYNSEAAVENKEQPRSAWSPSSRTLH